MTRLVHVETDGKTLIASIIQPRLLDTGVIQQVEKDLMDILGQSNEEQLVLNFGPVRFMSSSALGMLVRFRSKCQGFKVDLKLAGIDPNIREVFRITRLEKIFAIYPTSTEAKEAFQKRGGWFRR